jgi:membrane-bound serine protease (ClpP class)
MLNARVPIIVYVAPQGAWAGSAGTFITIAGNVAAMAPGSSIGAAHPVGIGGGAPSDEEEGESTDQSARKAENLLAAFIESIAEQRKRNVEWAAKAVRESVAVTADKALELGVIDIVAASRADLLTQLRGHPFPFEGGTVVLDLADAPQRVIEMDLRPSHDRGSRMRYFCSGRPARFYICANQRAWWFPAWRRRAWCSP